MKIKKTDRLDMLSRFDVGASVLRQLVVRRRELRAAQTGWSIPDASLVLGLQNDQQEFRFALESRSRSTPETIRSAIREAKQAAAMGDHLPLIQVPYLSPERLEELEAEQCSGVDMCENGVIIVPGRLYISRTGNPNAYPDSRPLSNPYRGKSAMVGRRIFGRPNWNSLSELADSVAGAGEQLSLSQVSKAVQALKDDLIVSKNGTEITLIDPARLLDRLGREWQNPTRQNWYPVRVTANVDLATSLSTSENLSWAVTGMSSASRYTTFVQGGPRYFAVSNADYAMKSLSAKPEPIPSFADLVLVEANTHGYYFDNEVDKEGMRWASRLQTWLELQAGDARQQEAANDLRVQLLASH